jgi:hypothetical protein
VNLLDFLAALMSTVASWPVVILVIVVILRRQIGDLLKSLSEVSLRYGELEIQAKREASLDRSEDITEQLELEAVSEPDALLPTEELDESLQKDKDRLYARAEQSSKNAVYNTWLKVQLEAESALSRNGLKERSTSASLTDKVRMLANERLVSPLVVSLADEIARLHNETLRGPVPVTQDAAIRYIDLSLRLVSYLRRA